VSTAAGTAVVGPSSGAVPVVVGLDPATVPAGGTAAADGPAPGLVGTAALGGGSPTSAVQSAVASAAGCEHRPDTGRLPLRRGARVLPAFDAAGAGDVVAPVALNVQFAPGRAFGAWW
jgi:hypothetical protein